MRKPMVSEGKGQPVLRAPAMESFLGPGNKILGKWLGWCVCRPEKRLECIQGRKEVGSGFQALEDNEEPTVPSAGLCVQGMFKAASNSLCLERNNRLCLERKTLPYVGKVEKTPGLGP